MFVLVNGHRNRILNMQYLWIFIRVFCLHDIKKSNSFFLFILETLDFSNRCLDLLSLETRLNVEVTIKNQNKGLKTLKKSSLFSKIKLAENNINNSTKHTPKIIPIILTPSNNKIKSRSCTCYIDVSLKLYGKHTRRW